jgi:hypothetical protein
MAFENSAATDPKDLVQKLNIFLSANGWTSDMSAADGAGWRVHLHKGAQYVHLRAQMNEVAPFQSSHGVNGYSVALYLGTSFVGGNAWNDQEVGSPVESGAPTRPVGAGMKMQAGAIPNYYFFTDTSNANVTVVVEHASGIYSHIGWGSLEQIGSWTGGDYFFGTWGGFFLNDPSTGAQPGDGVLQSANAPGTWADPTSLPNWFVRADVDSFMGKWICGGDVVAGFEGFTGKNGGSGVGGVGTVFAANSKIPTLWNIYAGAGDFSQQTSEQDGRSNLLPIVLYAQRDGSGPGYSPLGQLPTAYVSNGVGAGWAPGSDYTIGADTYTMFPQFAVLKVV